MHGQIDRQESLFVFISLEQRVPPGHPLRPIMRRCDELLAQMNRAFNCAYSLPGRPSIPLEQLPRALLLLALYSGFSTSGSFRWGTTRAILASRPTKSLPEPEPTLGIFEPGWGNASELYRSMPLGMEQYFARTSAAGWS